MMRDEINRVFLYGIDAGTWDFILPHIDSLPNFKRLISQSIWGNLESTIPPVTPAAWTTMFSGVNPQKHGIFGFTVSDDPISIRPPRVSKDTVGYPFIWDILTASKKFVVALFIPFAYPPSKVRGLFVSGMGTPDINSNFVYPSSRKDEIVEYGINPDIPQEELLDDLDIMKNTYMDNMKNSIELVKYLMEYDPWNLFIYVMEEIDRIQHVFWRFIDPMHPLYDEHLVEKYSSTILDFYTLADSFLGYLFKNLPSDSALIIASDHGMGSKVLNNWLYKNGYISIKGKISKNKKKINPKIKKIIKKYKLWNFVSKIYYNFFSKNLPAVKRWNIDWKNTIAYSIHPFLIQINKKSCKYGILSERDAKYYAEEIIEKLRRANIFGDVGYYSTDMKSCIPDIFVKPKNPTDFIIPFSNRTIEIIDGPINGGEHRMNGIYAIHYNEITPFHKDSHIVNITSTIMKILKYEIPKYMDGKSII